MESGKVNMSKLLATFFTRRNLTLDIMVRLTSRSIILGGKFDII